jgi:hypothetical protein
MLMNMEKIHLLRDIGQVELLRGKQRRREKEEKGESVRDIVLLEKGSCVCHKFDR